MNKIKKLEMLKEEYKILAANSTKKKMQEKVISQIVTLIGTIRFVEEEKSFLLKQISTLELEIKMEKKKKKEVR